MSFASTSPPHHGAPSGAEGETLHQIGALPLRRGADGYETCLVTTRETRRWTIPKGWPMKNRKDCEAAAIEAREEGGLVGKIGKRPIGDYLYWKRLPTELRLVNVAVYRLDVERQLDTWKEAGQRYVMWFPLEVAHDLVDEPGLKSLFASLARGKDGGKG